MLLRIVNTSHSRMLQLLSLRRAVRQWRTNTRDTRLGGVLIGIVQVSLLRWT